LLRAALPLLSLASGCSCRGGQHAVPAADAAPIEDCGVGYDQSDYSRPDQPTDLPLCGDLFPEGRVDSSLRFVERNDTDYAMRIVDLRESASSVDLYLGVLPTDPSEAPRVEIHFPPPRIGPIDLAGIGETVLLRGGDNPRGIDAYLRVMSRSGEILWEGGDTGSEFEFARMFVREPPDPVWCKQVPEDPAPDYDTEACCCVTRRTLSTVVRDVECDELVDPGTEIEAEIGARRYAIVSFGAYDRRDSPCSADVSAVTGSGYIVRLAR